MLTLYFRESDSGAVHGVQGVVLRVFAPLQNGTARATKPFRDAWNWTGDLFSAKSENAKLKKEVEQLRAGVAEQLTTQDENTQLRAIVALQGNNIFPVGAQLVTARVVARSTSAWYSTVTIDRGSTSGIAASGLSGVVGNSTPRTRTRFLRMSVENACETAAVTACWKPESCT